MDTYICVKVLTVVSIYAMGILATRLVGHGMIFGEDMQLYVYLLIYIYIERERDI